MAKHIDRALLHCITINNLLPDNRWKIALIGELSDKESLLQSELDRRFDPKNITIFTKRNKFTIEDGKHFDILIGCRPCDADKLILESATKYKKLFVLMPCTCGGIQRKNINLIRRYPVITHMDSFAANFDNGKCDVYGWIILFNKPT